MPFGWFAIEIAQLLVEDVATLPEQETHNPNKGATKAANTADIHRVVSCGRLSFLVSFTSSIFIAM